MSNFMNTSSSSSSNYGTNGGVLELTLKETLAVIKPSEEDVTARTRVIDELKAIVNQSALQYSSLRGAAVNPFGSYICNLYTRWGDLDISIQIQDPLRRSTALKHLREAVTRRNTFRITKFIPNARILLLVVESNNHNNITCDISIDNYAGVFKSIFLGWEWAKSEGINNSRNGTFTSYALSLLVIFHFQTCEPPVLPPLKELHTGEIVAEGRFHSCDLQDLRNQMTANVEKFKRERLTNTSSLSELFVSFFQKFSAIEMAKDNYFCTYTWKWEQSRGGFLSLLERSKLHIEDPFARLQNAARGVYDTRKISEAFQKTYSMLISASGRDRFSLITNLVRPEIRSQIITRG
ncbi:hypothetical protein MKW98_020877 [Papaver atlanticum]|uniref:Poly(A) RNA polymerase mitochondrial-like central palm domain-containing protein n=1 Tax=Papaver atlanticum TaxID=357466 RepID=A0AAD4XX67_9MAGN|nr:hypothetical protein MKW98_020877 [Papaver atlanticum]